MTKMMRYCAVSVIAPLLCAVGLSLSNVREAFARDLEKETGMLIVVMTDTLRALQQEVALNKLALQGLVRSSAAKEQQAQNVMARLSGVDQQLKESIARMSDVERQKASLAVSSRQVSQQLKALVPQLNSLQQECLALDSYLAGMERAFWGLKASESTAQARTLVQQLSGAEASSTRLSEKYKALQEAYAAVATQLLESDVALAKREDLSSSGGSTLYDLKKELSSLDTEVRQMQGGAETIVAVVRQLNEQQRRLQELSAGLTQYQRQWTEFADVAVPQALKADSEREMAKAMAMKEKASLELTEQLSRLKEQKDKELQSLAAAKDKEAVKAKTDYEQQIVKVITAKEKEAAAMSEQLRQYKAQVDKAALQCTEQLNRLKEQKDKELQSLATAKDEEASKAKAGFEQQASAMKTKLDEAVKEKESDLARLKGECEQQLSAIKNSLSSLSKEKEEINGKYHEQAALVAQLNVTQGQKEKELSSLNEKIQQSKEQQDADAKKLNDQKAVFDELSRLKSEQELVLMKCKGEFDQFKTAKEAEMRTLSTASEEYKAKKESEQLKLDAAIERLRDDLEARNDAVGSMALERDMTKGLNLQLQSQVKQLSAQLRAFITENQRLSKQNTYFKEDYVASAQKIAEAKQQYEEALNENERLAKLLKTAQKKLVEFSEEEIPSTMEPKAQHPVKMTKKPSTTAVADETAAAIKKAPSLQKAYRQLQLQHRELQGQYRALMKQQGGLPQEALTAHYNLGVMYTQNREYAKAIEEFQKVLEFKPDDADSHFNLGVIYSEYMGERAKALEHFQKYLRLSPDDADAERVRRYVATIETLQRE